MTLYLSAASASEPPVAPNEERQPASQWSSNAKLVADTSKKQKKKHFIQDKSVNQTSARRGINRGAENEVNVYVLDSAKAHWENVAKLESSVSHKDAEVIKTLILTHMDYHPVTCWDAVKDRVELALAHNNLLLQLS